MAKIAYRGYSSIASNILQGGWSPEGSCTPSAARLSDCKPHVPRSHSAARGSVSCRCAHLPGFGESEIPERTKFSYTFTTSRELSPLY